MCVFLKSQRLAQILHLAKMPGVPQALEGNEILSYLKLTLLIKPNQTLQPEPQTAVCTVTSLPGQTWLPRPKMDVFRVLLVILNTLMNTFGLNVPGVVGLVPILLESQVESSVVGLCCYHWHVCCSERHALVNWEFLFCVYLFVDVRASVLFRMKINMNHYYIYIDSCIYLYIYRTVSGFKWLLFICIRCICIKLYYFVLLKYSQCFSSH